MESLFRVLYTTVRTPHQFDLRRVGCAGNETTKHLGGHRGYVKTKKIKVSWVGARRHKSSQDHRSMLTEQGSPDTCRQTHPARLEPPWMHEVTTMRYIWTFWHRSYPPHHSWLFLYPRSHYRYHSYQRRWWRSAQSHSWGKCQSGCEWCPVYTFWCSVRSWLVWNIVDFMEEDCTKV